MSHSTSRNIPGGEPRSGEGDSVPLLLLAAGLSSRMRGADKLMESVGDIPLIRRQVLSVLEAGLSAHVALPGPDHPRALALSDLAHQPLFLPGSVEGMGGTLREGVAALPACRRFLILAADLPGLNAADLRAFVAADPGEALVVIATSADGALGHPVAFDASLRPEFAALDGDEGARAVVSANRRRMRTFALPGDHATRDLDTPEDWAEWRAEGPESHRR